MSQTPSQKNSPTSTERKDKRQYTEEHYNEDCRSLRGRFVNALFYNCVFEDLRGLELIDCVLEKSQFITTDPQHMLGFSVTLNCHSFNNVSLSPEVLRTLLMLICKSNGNSAERRAIINDVVGHNNAIPVLQQLQYLE